MARQRNRVDVMQFVAVFKAFNSVKSGCFGIKLDPNFAANIDDFQNALVALDELHKTSITPKFHHICIHVKQICEKTKGSLKLNEQALESSHSKFKKLLIRFLGANPDKESPLYALNILRVFNVFNSNATFRDSL